MFDDGDHYEQEYYENDLEEMGNREAWEDSRAEMDDDHTRACENADCEGECWSAPPVACTACGFLDCEDDECDGGDEDPRDIAAREEEENQHSYYQDRHQYGW